jgi:CheY-like chemotaxis protein
MVPEALLVCPQEESARALQPVLEQLGTRIEREPDAIAALARLQRHHYDTLIVDCEGGGDEAEVLRESHDNGLGRNTITIAVIGEREDAELAYAMGAHFVLKKPLTRTRVERLLRAAHALVQERRIHRRFACEGAATLWSADRRIAAELLDLSAGGAAVQLAGRESLAREVSVRFAVPGTSTFVRADGELAWHNNFSRAGVRFTRMTDLDRAALEQWLEQQRANSSSKIRPLV